MTKLPAAMFAALFALALNTATAEATKSNQDEAQTQTEVAERKIGRGEGTDWAGRRIETETQSKHIAQTATNAALAMTCQGKTGREKEKCLGSVQTGAANAGAGPKQKEVP